MCCTRAIDLLRVPRIPREHPAILHESVSTWRVSKRFRHRQRSLRGLVPPPCRIQISVSTPTQRGGTFSHRMRAKVARDSALGLGGAVLCVSLRILAFCHKCTRAGPAVFPSQQAAYVLTASCCPLTGTLHSFAAGPASAGAPQATSELHSPAPLNR